MICEQNFQDMNFFKDMEFFQDVDIFQDMEGLVKMCFCRNPGYGTFHDTETSQDTEIILNMEVKHYKLHRTTIGRRE